MDKNIICCILNHNSNKESMYYADVLKDVCHTVIIDSGSDVKPQGNVVLCDNIYYGGLVNKAIDLAIDGNYSWLIIITPDVVIEDVNKFKERLFENCDDSVGVWQPSVKRGSADYWCNFNNGTNLRCHSELLNGFFLCVNGSILHEWKKYTDGVVYGMICDISCSYLSHIHNKEVFVDNGLILFHPPGTSYSVKNAADEEFNVSYRKFPELLTFKRSIEAQKNKQNSPSRVVNVNINRQDLSDSDKRDNFKYTVLTYIFGGYEKLHEIKEKDPAAEYICVTDDEQLKSSSWKIVVDGRLKGMASFDKCCYVRYHPFEYCNTNICMKIDGSFIVKKSTANIIDLFEKGGFDMSIMIHPERNTLKDEYAVWIRTRNYPSRQANKILNYFNESGYPDEYKGLYQVGFSIQRNNDDSKKLNDVVYDTLKMLGDGGKIERLDQTIFSYILNTRFEHTFKIMPVSENLITHSDYFSWCFHNSNSPVPFKQKTIPPYMFNKPIDVCEF